MVFGLGACSNDDVDYEPAAPVEGAQVYFSNEASTTISATTETTSFEVVVMRGNVDEAITVPIKATITAKNVDEEAEPIDYASLFTIPQNVSFGAGKETTKISIGVDRENLEDGQTYNITLSLNDASVITPYGNSSVTYSLVVPEPLVYLGKATIREDIIATIFSIENIEWEVEVYENTKTPGYIYLKNAYTSEFPYNEPGDYVEEDTYFTINIADPDKVVIPTQTLGCDWNPTDYGEFLVGTAQYGTLKDGIITFPQKGLLIGMMIYTQGQFGWYANSNGLFRVVLPGAVLTDYSLDVAYGGFRVAADNATVYPIARAAYGADVAEIQYAFVPGDITADAEALAAALAGIEDGSIVSNQVAVTSPGVDEETGEPILEMTLESVEGVEPGVFTVIAIPYSADGEAQYGDLACTSFYVQGVGAAEAPEVDFAAIALPITKLFPYEQYGISDAHGLAWYAEGSEIKTMLMGLWADADIEAILAAGYTIEDIAAEGDAMDPTKLNTNGYAGGGASGLEPETGYTYVFYVENVYGSSAIVTASGTTAAEDAAASKLTWSTPNIDMSKAGISVKQYSKITLK